MRPAQATEHANLGVVRWAAPLWRRVKSDKWALLDTGDLVVVHRYHIVLALPEPASGEPLAAHRVSPPYPTEAAAVPVGFELAGHP
jgi:hypothetical protein